MLGEAPPNVQPEAFGGERQRWKTPSGPHGGALLLCDVCVDRALLGGLLEVLSFLFCLGFL